MAALPGAAQPGPPGPTPTGPPRLVNLYHVRAVATPKQCYVCHRETTTCLATEGVTDFLYTCKHHLLDPGFARPAPTSGTASSSAAPASPTTTTSTSSSPVPQSEIDKVKKEYEEKQKRKEAAQTQASDAADPGSKKKDSSGPASTAFSLLKTGASALSALSSQASSSLFPPPPPAAEPSAAERTRAAAAQAKVFALHKDFFRMRQDRKRKEWEKKDAEERGRQWSFPQAPRGALTGP
ncbi:hypothetical protein JCM3774_006552 [Rhodotorula dairenensis]